MDLAGANLIEPGDNALVVSTGYFGNRFADLLGRYGANVEVLQADTGDIVPHDIIENKLKEKPFKLLCFTHVDTSTAVKNDPAGLATVQAAAGKNKGGTGKRKIPGIS